MNGRMLSRGRTAAIAAALAVAALPAASATATATGDETIVARRTVEAEARSSVHLGELGNEPAPAPEQGSVTPQPGDTGPALQVPPHAVVPSPVEEPSGTEEPPPADSPVIASSFEALGDNNASIPPDTHGAVSTTHVMTTLNTQVRVQSRTGSVLTTVTLDQFWANAGNPDAFDPKTLYDPYSGRFMTVAMGNARADSKLLIAVSATSDPTGTWYLWSYDMDPGNGVWVDYPSIGFNKKWISVGVNLYTNGGSYVRSEVWLWQKPSLYAGSAGTASVWDMTGYGGTHVPATTYDSAAETLYLLQTWNGNSGGSGYLRLYSINGSPGSETLSAGGYPSGPAWASAGTTNRSDFAPQAGTSRRIQTNDNRMQSVAYRNGSIWAAHTVFLPASGPTRSAAQWWQISPSASVAQRGLIEDPTGHVFYYFPSIAVNANSDVLVGYSRSSTSEYASAGFSHRRSFDPAGTMRAPAILKAGVAPYNKDFGSGRNRWGDYSATVVDPVNDVDFWTLQEWAQAPSGLYDRWSTWWGRIALDVTPGASVSPSSVDFGSRSAGSAPVSQQVSVSSTGTGPLSVSSALLLSGTSPEFSITGDTCSGTSVPVGGSCAVTVTFAASSSLGTKSGTLRISTNASGSPHDIPLSAVVASDGAAPASSFQTPSGSVRAWPLMTVSGSTADDSSGVSSVVVTYQPFLAGLSFTSAPALNCSTGNLSCSWTTGVPAVPGIYFVNARGTDVAGNVESPGPTIVVYVV